MKKPNIILFITHDQGHFLGCYNSSLRPNNLKTPNLDKIAKDGVKFTNYFCTAPQCSPSRGSIQTSLYPHQNSLMGLVNRGWTLPKEFKTIPMYLKELGYSTHLIGLNHESRNPSDLGYDTMTERFFSKRGVENTFLYNCNLVERESEKFFQEHKNDEKPFYVSVGVEEVHRPFRAWADPVDPDQVKVPLFLPDNEIIRKEISEYYGAINRVDLTIERINTILKDLGLNEDTLFIYTTDHGSPFPRAKCTLYDPGIETILLMYQPTSNIFSSKKVIDNLLSNIDLLPTLIDYIGGEIPKNIEGKSFLPILKEEQKEIRNEIFMEKTYHEIYDPIRGIRTTDYKYIRNFENLDTQYQMPLPILMAPSGKFIKNFYNTPRPTEELYDLRNDPFEKTNLINMVEYQKIATELREKLFNWLKISNDPILLGKIPKQESVNKKIKKIKEIKN